MGMTEALISFAAAAVVAGTPLLFAIIGEIITERSGKLNLGVEGMMLMGAVLGFFVGLKTANPILAVSAAAAAGGLGAAIYSLLTITLRANQIVTGLALTIFGTGFASYMGKQLIGSVAPEGIKTFFVDISIPVLGSIPVIGEIFFQHSIFVYFGYIAAISAGLYLYKTRTGLNLRAVGENMSAADAAGINVEFYQYLHTIIGGAMAGIAGGYLSLVYVPAWQENVTAGRGWIAVALVIFCRWNPLLALFGAYVFGGLDIIGFRLQQFDIQISQYLIDMLPYIITIVLLVGASIKKSKENSPPGALGLPYFREDR